MKRVYKSPATPERLRSYVKAFPDETWEHFRRRNRRGYREVKQQLLQDQHGLCAYCEISIKLAEFEDNVDDFRVEHFFPKVATQLEKHNYHLDWHNLLGVCHGGSQPYVSDPEWRYSSRKNDRSCDVPKGGKPISERILNPLKIPASVRLFRYQEHTGKMIVDESSCPKKLQAEGAQYDPRAESERAAAAADETGADQDTGGRDKQCFGWRSGAGGVFAAAGGKYPAAG